MELLQLTYFCSAAEKENFSKTAKEYNVPASNISQSIHRLEKEIGTKLFDRTANRIRLNEKGKMFYKDVKNALMSIDNATKKIYEQEEISGEIRILANTNRRIVTAAMEAFEAQYDGVSFFINHSLDEDIDKYDLIITDRIIDRNDFSKQLLMVDEILLAMSVSNPFANKEIFLSDLESERFITMNDKSGLYRLTNEICNSAGFAPHIAIQSDDPYYIRKYIEMGQGVSFIPSISWKGLFSKNVVCKKITDTKRFTYVYNNNRRYMSRATSIFLQVLNETAQKHLE